MPLFVQNTNP